MDSLQDSMRAASVYPKPVGNKPLTPRPAAVCAADIMTKNILVLDPNMPVPDAIRALVKRRVSGAPVVSAEGVLVGVLSELDCMQVLATSAFHQEAALSVSKVAELMSETTHTIPPGMDLCAIVQKFTELRVRRLLVLEDGELVGIVSRRDVLVAMQDLIL